MGQEVSAGEVFRRAGNHLKKLELAEAEHLYRALLSVLGANASVVHNLAVTLLIQDRVAEARDVVAQLENSVEARQSRVHGILDAFSSFHPALPEWRGTVVIPAYRAEAFVTQALESVRVAIDLLGREGGSNGGQIEIVVVDDASDDGTVEVCRRWAVAKDFSNLQIVQHGTNRGVAAARNTGARVGRGDYLWFLDADDQYRPHHLLYSWSALRARPLAGFIRMDMIFEGLDERVTTTWREANQITSTINLCVRRVCHNFVGGLPEDNEYRLSGGEDAAYSERLSAFFIGILCDARTVVYRRRPGNSLDHQAARFMGEEESPSQASDKDMELSQAVGKLLTQRCVWQLQNLLRETPPTFSPMPERRDRGHWIALKGTDVWPA